MPPSSPTSPPDPSPRSSPGGSAPGRERRALRWGLGISVGVHLLLLIFYPLVMDRLTPDPWAPQPDDPELHVPAMEVVALRETPPEEEEAPEPEEAPEVEPDEEITPDPVEPEAVPPPVEVPTVEPDPEDPEEEASRRTMVELLTPQTGDVRLWEHLEGEYMRLTDEERAQLMLYGMLRSWNDSMAVAAALSDAARDWTYTDEEGRRWGLSPGQLHLGDFSIPLPLSFSGPHSFLEDRIHQEWILQDLARGAAIQAVRQTWVERARAIRERMDAEREQRRTGSGGGGGN